MPRMRKPKSLQSLSGLYTMQNLWPVVRHAFGIEGPVSLKAFLASHKGESFLNCIEKDNFNKINPFRNVNLYLEEFMSIHGNPRQLGRLLYLIYIALLQPKSIELGAWMLSSRCGRAVLKSRPFQNVRELWINDARILRALLVSPGVQNFSNLEILSGDGTDQLLLEASKYCPQLKVIDIVCSVRNSVTDAGLVACSRLSQLTSVSLMDDGVTVTGIQFLLDRSTKLQKMTFNKTSDVEVLAEIYARLASSNKAHPLPEYHLRKVNDDRYRPGTSSPRLGQLPLSCAVLLCPRMTSFSLCSAMTDEELRALVNLSCLTSLSITASYHFEPEFTFTGGILPVLQKHGGHLKRLALRGLSDINMEIVLHLCPAMETFEFASCFLTTDWPPTVEKPDRVQALLHLRTIFVNCWETCDFEEHDPFQYWHLLMLSPHLEEVKIEGARHLSDSIVEEILERNKFPNLKRLVLESLPRISTRSVWNFLYLDNNLEDIYFCAHKRKGLVTKRDIVALEDYCKDFDVEFFFRRG